MATTHIPVPSLGRPPRRTSNHGGALAAGLVLALLLGAGLLLWQLTREEETATPATDAPAAVADTAPTGSTPAAMASVVVYIVAGAEEAAQLRRGLIDEPLLEQPALQAAVIPVSGDEELARVQLFIAELNRLRGDDGLASIEIVDLRAPPAATDRNPPPCADGGAGDPTLVRDTCW